MGLGGPPSSLLDRCGFLWLLLFRWVYRRPEDHAWISDDERREILADREAADPAHASGAASGRIGYATLLTLPQTWGVMIGKALTDPVWFLITDWFALLLLARGFRLEDTLLAFWVPFVADIARRGAPNLTRHAIRLSVRATIVALPKETYTHGHHESVLRSHTWRTAQNSAAYLLDRLRPGMSLLDVGCGPGTITVDLAARVAPGRVVGLDAATSIVEQARGLSDAVEWRVGDAYTLDADLHDFDVVHAHQVLQHLADPVGALRAWGAACRPGGIVAARDGDYAAFTWYPHDPLLARWLDLYRFAARANGGEPDAGRRLLAWAHEAGFDDVTATASVWCYATPDERAWWAGLWADRMTTSAIGAQLVASGESSIDELRAVAEAWRRWAAHPDGWFLVPHGEIIARV